MAWQTMQGISVFRSTAKAQMSSTMEQSASPSYQSLMNGSEDDNEPKMVNKHDLGPGNI